MEESTYDDYQTARIQEKPEELPPGQIPRFLDVSLRGPVIEKARPGDPVMATGILVPFVYSRFGSCRLNYKRDCRIHIWFKNWL